ncbi:AraC-like DNA-binding protein [Aquimarina sp. MAR_2010_214]|uniref:helix-turn-helix domain-containing protein n=1 Tax=Aquimarina sp. MAR_2010_214 TaxID=1250026 RepID=UPI000C70294D|nr:AraC family transcriptional regulator [Aquimarina sp. MAR_2010_214]PKV48934.1 AraC-like DNA-binding protein [Aquimarina sp. MAR_2010_214]
MPAIYNGKTTGIALKYVVEGKEHYKTNRNQLDVYKSQFIILRENVDYEVYSKNINTKGFCLDINPELLDIEISDFLQNDLLFNQPFSGTLSIPLGKSLYDFSNTTSEYDFLQEPIGIITNFKDDLLSFQKELDIIEDSLQKITTRIHTQKLLVSKLFKAREYIHLYYSHKISLSTLASISGISKYHFARVFKICFKMTPLQMQEKLRMEKAKELLHDDKISLTSIAYQLGYTDLSSFSKRFKKYYKMPPSQYIK